MPHYKVFKGSKGRKVSKELKEFKELREHKELKVYKELKVFKVFKEFKVLTRIPGPNLLLALDYSLFMITSQTRLL